MLHIGRNILSLVMSRVLSGVILFLITTRLLAYLNPEAAGHYGLLSSYLTVFSFLVDLGMSQLIIKKMSEDKENIGKYLSSYFLIQTLLGLAFMLIMAGFVWSAEYPQHVKNALYVSSFALFLSSMSLPLRSVIVSMQRLTITARINFFNALINASMMALAIYFRQNVFFLAFIGVTIGLFDILVYGIIVHRKFTKITLNFNWPLIRQLFIWNMPFMLLTFFSIYNRVDGLILPHFRSFEETGYYAAAYRFWDALAFFPGILGITLYPFFADALHRNLIDNVKIGLETYTRYMIAIGVPMSVGAFFLADKIIVEFIEPSFLPAAQALWLLVLAVSILFVYTPVNSLMVSRLTKKATQVTAFTFFFNIIANLIFIPLYGFVAAAAITAASELIQTIGYTYYTKKEVVKFKFFRSFLKPLAASTVMASFLFLFQDRNLWIVITVSAAIYAVSLFILRFFHQSDWDLFKAAINIKRRLTPEEAS